MDVAEINIWGELVGAVAWDPRLGYSVFEYEPAFKSLGWDLAPLTMPVLSSRNLYTFPELRMERQAPNDTFKGLPGLLADSLPDRYGNQLINIWLARQGRSQDSMNPVEMLCFMGSRGMGALEYQPKMLKEPKRTSAVDIDSLVEVSRRMLQNRATFRTRIRRYDEQAVADILRIGTSAGGARPKAVIAWNERTGEVRSGQTTTPKGFAHWLIKLDGVSDTQLGSSHGYGRVEMAYHNMAKDCGIHMMPSRLLEENGRAHFMTMRFDRGADGSKHHVQTLCAIKHFDFSQVGSFSYEQLFQCMRELRLSYADAEQMFRRMVFNVVARNCDDHTKNLAFLLKKDGRWELAPAYDVCHAYRPDSEWVSQHALSVNGRRTAITKSDLETVGESIRCKRSSEIIDEINTVVLNWKRYANAVGVHRKLRDQIGKTLIDLR